MADKKKCPMRKGITLDTDIPGKYEEGLADCIEEECAWWVAYPESNAEHSCCTLLEISRSISDIDI